MTPEEIATDEARRAVLVAEINERKAEVQKIDDRATAMRVHRLTLLMAKHAEHDEAEARAALAIARVRERKATVFNPPPFNERAERDTDTKEAS